MVVAMVLLDFPCSCVARGTHLKHAYSIDQALANIGLKLLN